MEMAVDIQWGQHCIYANKNRPSVITSETDILGLSCECLYVLSRGINVFQVTSEEKENLEASVTEKNTNIEGFIV